MRLYVVDPSTNQKIHLQMSAKDRKELASTIGAPLFTAGNKHFHVSDVKAEVGADNATISALVGGLVGALGGAPGVVAGGLLGALIGNSQAESEKRKAEIFNESEV